MFISHLWDGIMLGTPNICRLGYVIMMAAYVLVPNRHLSHDTVWPSYHDAVIKQCLREVRRSTNHWCLFYCQVHLLTTVMCYGSPDPPFSFLTLVVSRELTRMLLSQTTNSGPVFPRMSILFSEACLTDYNGFFFHKEFKFNRNSILFSSNLQCNEHCKIVYNASQRCTCDV